MNKTFTNFLLAGFGMIISCAASANNNNEKLLDSAPNPYQTMLVSVTNMTHSSCTRVNYYVTHGHLVDGHIIPQQINKDETITFLMEESALGGPDVQMTYRCGDEAFRVRAWQRKCMLAYGCDTHAEVQSKMPHINVDEPVDVTNASRYWNMNGGVHFTVREK